MTNVKIYAMNDCDWMAAETLESAKEEYIKKYAGDYDSAENPSELTDEGMDGFILHDATGEEPDRTFREALAEMIARGVEFPAFFASTEY